MYNSTKFLHATNHNLFQCIDFKKYFKILKTNNMRIMQIQNKDCIHDSCRICDKKYNILLHVESKNRVRTTNILIVMDKEIMNETQYTKFIIFIYIKWNNNFIYSDNNCKESIWKRKVLLSTSQSQSHFINRAMLKRLGFIRIRTHIVKIGDFAHRI